MIERLTYSPTEAADQLGVSEKTIKRLVQRRELSYTKVGRQIRFTPAHLKDFLRRNETHAIGQGV